MSNSVTQSRTSVAHNVDATEQAMVLSSLMNGSLPKDSRTSAAIPDHYLSVPVHDAFSTTVSRVVQLLQDEGDDGKLYQPTSEAFAVTMELLLTAQARLQHRFPRAAAALDESGGIRLYWTNGDRRIQLVIPPSSTPITLFRSGDTSHDIEHNASLGLLVQWLRWLDAA